MQRPWKIATYFSIVIADVEDMTYTERDGGPFDARYFLKLKVTRSMLSFHAGALLEIKHISYTVIGDWWGKDRN